MKKKRVIISVTNDLVSDQRVHKVALTLSENGFEVLLVGRKLKNSIQIETRKYKTKRMPLIFTKGAMFYFEFNLRLFFVLLFNRANFLLSNDLDTLLSNFLVSKITNRKLVYDSHEYFTQMPELINRPRIQKFWHILEKFLLPKLTRAYTVCDSIANEYKKEYNIDFKVIRNLPNKTNYDIENINPFPNDKQIIIYQGALNVGRGLELMIEAMQFIKNAVFVIIGKGDIDEKLKSIAFKFNVTEKVLFVGKIPFYELPKYTNNAHLGISIEENLGLNYYYALPNKLFDYIQAKVPVLVSDFPEMKNIVETYKIGDILVERTPQKLAEKINNILISNNQNSELKQNLETAANELVWENENEILLSLFK
jgi:glycosyltransferase involved in cell wall biosynthesis